MDKDEVYKLYFQKRVRRMLYEIREAIGEVCNWVGGVASCTAQGLVAGAAAGAGMGAGFGYVVDPVSNITNAKGAVIGAIPGAIIGAVTCGGTRMFSKDAGRKITMAAWGAAAGSIVMFPVYAQALALMGALAGWKAKDKTIQTERYASAKRAERSLEILGIPSVRYRGLGL